MCQKNYSDKIVISNIEKLISIDHVHHDKTKDIFLFFTDEKKKTLPTTDHRPQRVCNIHEIELSQITDRPGKRKVVNNANLMRPN